jgi:hypothetical protein
MNNLTINLGGLGFDKSPLIYNEFTGREEAQAGFCGVTIKYC